MLSFLQEIRLAARYLARRRATTLTAAGVLALGIGSSTSMFSVIDGILLHPLPYESPRELVTIWQTFPHWRGEPTLDATWDRIALDWPTYDALRSASLLESVGAYRVRESTMLAGELPERVASGRATSSLATVLGIAPQQGRWFVPADEGPAGNRVAVISDRLWRSRYGADSSILGTPITIDEVSYQIVGVLAPTFRLGGLHPFAPRATPEVWTPIGLFQGELQPGNNNYEVIARLTSVEALDPATSQVHQIVIGNRDTARIGSRTLRRLDAQTISIRTPLRYLVSAVGLLLVLACANVAMLLLAEVRRRASELRLRAALGASRTRLIRQMLTESLMLAIVGALPGVLIATFGTRLLLALAPIEIPRAIDVQMRMDVLLAALAIAVFTGLLFGMLPALMASRSASLTGAGISRHIAGGRTRLSEWLMGIQVALCAVLLAVGMLLGRSLWEQREVAPGFTIDNLLTMQVTLPRSALPGTFADAALAAVSSLPGVVGVTLASAIPFGPAWGGWSVESNPSNKLSLQSPSMSVSQVHPGFFELLGVRLVSGRVFNTGDDSLSARVAVIDATMAKRLWPGQNAVGREFRYPNGVARVVGVVTDIHARSLDTNSEGAFYLSSLQATPRNLYVVVRTTSAPNAHIPAIRMVLQRIAPTAPVTNVASMSARIDDSLADDRYRGLLIWMFAGMASLMAIAGIAGLATRTVGQRLRELAIRMALGATPASASRRMLRLILLPASVGLAVGIAAVVAFGRLIQHYLFGVPWWDPVALSTTAVALQLALIAAVLVPLQRVRRATLARELAGD